MGPNSQASDESREQQRGQVTQVASSGNVALIDTVLANRLSVCLSSVTLVHPT